MEHAAPDVECRKSNYFFISYHHWKEYYPPIEALAEKVVTCSECGGIGKIECESCFGKGWTRCYECSGYGYVIEPIHGGIKSCPVCGGSGSIVCRECLGTGKSVCPSCEGVGTDTAKLFEDTLRAVLRGKLVFTYKVTMPGKIIESNAHLVENNTASWSYDFFDMGDARVLTVSSRYINWPLILLCLGSLGGLAISIMSTIKQRRQAGQLQVRQLKE